MKLAIISHTEHFKREDGTIVGWGPTITEINHLLDVFEEIYHIGMLHDVEAPAYALPYKNNRIKFVALPAIGGSTFIKKLDHVFLAPKVLKIVARTLKKVDLFQFRAPTGIGVYLIPYLILFSSKKGWFKYAGNWNQKNASLTYRFQRWLLRNQKRIVTINGKWMKQPDHCLSFENPCLTLEEIELAKEIIKDKNIDGKINVCFVGRLEKEKGVDLMIDALNALSSEEKEKFGTIHLVGDGKFMQDYKNQTLNSGLNYMFYGFLSRTRVQDVYVQSQVFILPSESEGFPKVISEAINFGCVPIVTDISAIEDYVKDQINGFLLSELTQEHLVLKIREMLSMKSSEYIKIINSQSDKINKFSFSYYNTRIKKEILNSWG